MKTNTMPTHRVWGRMSSLADFAKLMELFDAHNVSFVSVTQSFNTSSVTISVAPKSRASFCRDS
jgi:hypothetical protein